MQLNASLLCYNDVKKSVTRGHKPFRHVKEMMWPQKAAAVVCDVGTVSGDDLYTYIYICLEHLFCSFVVGMLSFCTYVCVVAATPARS